MKLKIFKMVIDNWLFKHLGEMLIISGLLGIGVNIFYDCITGKAIVHWGYMQYAFFVYSFAMIYAGWGWFGFIRTMRKDMEE